MSDYFEWPSILVPRDINLMPPRDTQSLSTSLTNFEQIVPVIRPPWRVTLQFPTLAGEDQILAYRATLALFEGRANFTRLPLFDFYAAGANLNLNSYVPHSDDTPFSDGTLYAIEDLQGVTISVAQGARSIEIDFGNYGHCIKAGQYFGIDNNFYMARRIWWNGNVATIDTTPTMRKTYVQGRVRLKPYLICRLTDDDVGEHSLNLGQWTKPTLSLIEGFYEPLS